MTDKKMELLPGEEILLRNRPQIKSFWVFFLGFILCVVGPFTREDPPMSITTGLVFGGIFALIIVRRWSNLYTLTNKRITVNGGLFARDTMEIMLTNIRSVQTNQGLTLRLVGVGHLLISSTVPHEENIIMYGQIDPLGLKERLEILAAQVQAAQTGGKDDSRNAAAPGVEDENESRTLH